MNKIRVSREELYRQVWETPMVKLAANYGISGNGLAKICSRMSVPYPPRGYWAKKAAGHAVVVSPLPDPLPNTIRETAIARSLTSTKIVEPDLAVVDAVKETLTRLRGSSGVRKSIKLHPVIAGWRAEHARALKEHKQSKIALWPAPDPFTDADLRRHDLLNVLFSTLEEQGGRIAIGERRELQCVMDGEVVAFQLREKLRRLPSPSVLEDKHAESIKNQWWHRNLKPTGRFVFSIKTYLPGNLRREWLETTEHPIEGFLPEIAAVFVTAGPLLVEQRRKRAEEEKQRLIVERQRYEENERRKLDRHRWRRFMELAQQHEEVRIARAFLTALKSEESSEGESVAAGRDLSDWIAWAESWTQVGDPLGNGAKGVFEEVARVTSWTYRD